MNQPHPRTETEPDFFDQPLPAVGPSTGQWQQIVDRLRNVDDDDPLRIPRSRASSGAMRQIGQSLLQKFDHQTGQPPRPAPEQKPVRPTRRQYIRRRIGAAALALSLGTAGVVFGGPRLIEAIKTHPYDVDDRTPTDDEICTIRRAGHRALLIVASEFTDDLGSRRAAASRINRATRNQDDDRFGICYDPNKDYSRVLTDEAVENLPPERLVSWESFPGRTDR